MNTNEWMLFGFAIGFVVINLIIIVYIIWLNNFKKYDTIYGRITLRQEGILRGQELI